MLHVISGRVRSISSSRSENDHGYGATSKVGAAQVEGVVVVGGERVGRTHQHGHLGPFRQGAKGRGPVPREAVPQQQDARFGRCHQTCSPQSPYRATRLFIATLVGTAYFGQRTVSS